MLAVKSAVRPAVAAALAILVYYICLRFAFPGWFSPLVPYHPDAFGPAGLQERPWVETFTYPRPVTFFFLRFEGMFGVAGSIFISVLVALLFALAVVFFVSRWSGTRATWLAICCFLVIFCAQPEFYFEHRHDVPIALSGIMLLAGAECWRKWLLEGRGAALGCCLLLVAALGLTKETYFASLGVLLVGMVVLERMYELRRVALPLVAVAAVGCVSMAITFLGFQRWVAPAAGTSTNYHVSLAPAELAKSLGFYTSHLFNWATPLVLAVVVLSVFRDRRRLVLAVVLFLAGVAALLPNSVLPNHPAEQYSWDAVAFTFGPVLLVSGELVTSILLMAATGVWLWANQATYRSVPLQWRLREETANQHILAGFPRIHQIDPTAKRMLVTGLVTRLNPWLAKDYIHHEFGDREWTVVATPDEPEKKDGAVEIVHAGHVTGNFDAALEFDDKGNLVRVLDRGAIAQMPREALLAPELRDLQAELDRDPNNADTLLKAGIACMRWGFDDHALDYLAHAAAVGDGTNPYPYFFMGQVHERRSDLKTALREYEQAMKLDPARSNPAFQEAVERVRRVIPHTS